MCLLYNFIYNVNFFFFKQKTAYEVRISDWSSDVCSSDLSGCSRRLQSLGKTDVVIDFSIDVACALCCFDSCRIKPCLLRGGFDALFRQLLSAIKRTVEAAIFALLGCIQTGLRRLPAFIAQYGKLEINHLQPFVLPQQAVNVGQAGFAIAADIVEELEQNDIAALCPSPATHEENGRAHD